MYSPPCLQKYVPESSVSAAEMMRLTRTLEGDLSVIMETPGRGPE